MNIAAILTKDSVRRYYGEVLQTGADLKTGACCPVDSMPRHLQPLLQNIHSEIHSKFYGCGSPIPHALFGKTVLDLGCGTGRDSYLLSQLVGPNGRVIGVDMTEGQIEIARKHREHQMRVFGFDRPNVEFELGYIEDLSALGIADATIDVVVSNCVINLCADKSAVFREILRVLVPGGELYFSDVFAGRRIPDRLQFDDELLGECLSGTLYIEDFRRILRSSGCLDYRVVSKTPISIDNEGIDRKIGMIDFYSTTVRTFRMEFEDICENYGHVARYKGSISDSPHHFVLDDHHVFKTGLPVAICGNTARMLSESRYGAHFDVWGDFSVHYGPFDCDSASSREGPATTGMCC